MKVGTTPNLVFGHVMFIFFQLFLVSLEILDHEILPDKFVMVWIVVDDLSVIESHTCVMDRKYLTWG